MLHLAPELVAGVLGDAGVRPAGLPLFTAPVVEDPALARRLRRLHGLLLEGATRLEAHELLTDTVLAMVRRHARGGASGAPWRDPWRPAPAPGPHRNAGGRRRATPAEVVRHLLDDRFAEDLGADDLAAAVGLSRFQVARRFQLAYGMAPSAYLRQVRLRDARRRLAAGEAIGTVAVASGFADQSHLTRWFRRTYGITPGVYQRGSGPVTRNPTHAEEAGSVSDNQRQRVLDICLSLPEATKLGERQLGFQVRGKSFAHYLDDHHGDGELAVAFKAAPGENRELIASDPRRFFLPAYVGPKGWVALRLDTGSVDWSEVAEMALDSYRIVAPKRLATAAELPAV
jgi:AraC-like DNA-binding protein